MSQLSQVSQMSQLEAQHAAIYALVGEFTDAVRTRRSTVFHLAILEEIVDALLEHFALEERLMRNLAPGRLKSHRQTHLAMLAELQQIRRDAERDGGVERDFTHALDAVIVHQASEEPVGLAEHKPPG
jgi:hemerythrin-like metal-binding protein